MPRQIWIARDDLWLVLIIPCGSDYPSCRHQLELFRHQIYWDTEQTRQPSRVVLVQIAHDFHAEGSRADVVLWHSQPQGSITQLYLNIRSSA